VEQVDVDVIVDQKLRLLFNLMNPQRFNIPSCPGITVYSTTLKGVIYSPKPQAHMISPVKSEDVRESLDLIPSLSYVSQHNKEMLQEE